MYIIAALKQQSNAHNASQTTSDKHKQILDSTAGRRKACRTPTAGGGQECTDATDANDSYLPILHSPVSIQPCLPQGDWQSLDRVMQEEAMRRDISVAKNWSQLTILGCRCRERGWWKGSNCFDVYQSIGLIKHPLHTHKSHSPPPRVKPSSTQPLVNWTIPDSQSNWSGMFGPNPLISSIANSHSSNSPPAIPGETCKIPTLSTTETTESSRMFYHLSRLSSPVATLGCRLANAPSHPWTKEYPRKYWLNPRAI